MNNSNYIIILIALTICIGLCMVHLWNAKGFNRVLALLLTVALFMWNVGGVMLSLATEDKSEIYLRYASIDLGLLSVTMLTLCFIQKLTYFQHLINCFQNYQFTHWNFGRYGSISTSFLGVFVLLAIGQISISSANSYQSSDYLSSMSTNINDFGTRGFAVNGVSIFISQVILSFYFAIVVFGDKRNRVDKITWWVSILCIIYFAFNLVGIGARIYMMFPLLALFVRFMLQKRSALSRIVHTTIIALLAIVGLWMAVVIQNYRQVKNIEFDDFIESRNAVSFNNVLEVLTEKFNSVDNGVILIEYYGFGFAPFRPFYGAILSPIPRIVYPDKPVPGSYNNDYTGTPTRMVAYLLGYGEDSGTVGVSQSAITLWQLGWPGFGIFVIFNVLNIMLVNGFLNAKSIFIKAIGIYVCSVPQIDGLYATIDAIILKQERAFMLVGLVYLLYVLFGVNNKLQHNHKKLTRTPQRKLA